MTKDTIISLDDKSNYLLLDETEMEGKKIFYANKLNDATEPTKEYAFIEEIDKDGDIYTKLIKDNDTIKYLTTVFTINYIDDVESGKYD